MGVEPPFAVSGELQGLYLQWFDGEGTHTAKTRSEIPEARRQHVRVDPLSATLGTQLPEGHVYLADVRTVGASGQYAVRMVSREAYDTLVERARPRAAANAAAARQVRDVIVYGASWCQACTSTKQYLRSKGVAFVEKDVEREPGASREMHDKARAAGISSPGIPVVDFDGNVFVGFSASRLDQLIAKRGT